MKNFRQWILLGSLMTGLGLIPSVGHAANLEPANNTPPWKDWATQADTTLYLSNYTTEWGWGGFESITSATDVDYVILSCATGNISMLGVDIGTSADIDIDAYTHSGTSVGYSHGTTNKERIYPTIAKPSLILKIFGYAGATGGVNIRVVCT